MDYAEYLVGLGLSGKSVRLYVKHVERAERWMARHTHTTLHWCGPAEIAAYAQTLPNSHSTRGQVVAALRHYWDWKGRTNTPHRAVRVPPAPEMVCRAITETQARDLVKVSLGWWPQGTVVLCGLYLALRRFEIAKMEWSRFDDRYEWYRVTGKYDKTSTLPVHPNLAWGGGDAIADLFAMDFQIALGAAAGGAVLSVLTSIVSAPIGADDSPSAIE